MNGGVDMPEQIAKGTVVLGDEFAKHRITGFVPHAQARGMDPNLDCDLITHVKDGLWQGGCLDEDAFARRRPLRLPDEFDYVLSLYQWGLQYELPEGCERDIVTMYDSLDQGFEQVEELADDIVYRLDEGQTVLIHCQAGLNRSGLLTARVLTKMGHTPGEAIGLLRAQRSPLVLCNEAFENWLMGCS